MQQNEIYEINKYQYELLFDDNCFSLDKIKDYVTDYFDDFDYIFGDYASDRVRLKGFYEVSNVKAKQYNSIEYLDYYKNEYCNYGAKTFLLKKVQKK